MEIRFHVSNQEYDIFLNDCIKAKKYTFQHTIELTNFNKHFERKLNSEMIGCFDNDKLIGLAWCPINNNEVTISDIIVHPTITRKGIGKNIVEVVIDKYANDYLIFTYPLDEKAKKFFVKMGFIEDNKYYQEWKNSMYFKK